MSFSFGVERVLDVHRRLNGVPDFPPHAHERSGVRDLDRDADRLAVGDGVELAAERDVDGHVRVPMRSGNPAECTNDGTPVTRNASSQPLTAREACRQVCR